MSRSTNVTVQNHLSHTINVFLDIIQRPGFYFKYLKQKQNRLDNVQKRNDCINISSQTFKSHLLYAIYCMLIIYIHTWEVNYKKLFRLLLLPWEKQTK